MMNGYSGYQQDAIQTVKAKWPYQQAKNYSDWQSIFQTFPHLKQINTHPEGQVDQNVSGIVIRSANDDNVHKAIKYGIWTTTPKNKSKIEQLWQRKINNNTNTYLFFSAVKSGMFEGVARLKSGYHEQTFPFWWENHTLKFKGYFQIEWVYIKDINNKHFSGLYNIEGDEVVKSKDCDTLDSQTTLKMLSIFDKKVVKRNIFVDFAYMDERESQYIRKMYEHVNSYYGGYQMNYAPNNGFDLSQYSLVGHPLNLVNSLSNPINPINPINPVMVPQILMRPGGVGTDNQRNNLGFQMNPVGKNKKK